MAAKSLHTHGASDCRHVGPDLRLSCYSFEQSVCSSAMNETRRTARNFGAVVIAETLGKVITFYAVAIHLAGYLTQYQFGVYSQVFVFISFCFLLADFGMDRIIVREISRTPDLIGQIAGSALLIKGVLVVTAICLANFALYVAGDFLNYSSELQLLIRFASIGILFSIFSVFGAILHFRRELQRRNLATVVSRIVAAGAILLLIYVDAPLAYFVIAGLLFGVPGAMIGIPEAVLLYLFYRRSSNARLGISARICWTLIRESAPIALCDLFIITYARIDQIMLQSMLGKEELVATYNYATRFAEVLRIIPLAFIASIFPSLCKAHNDASGSFEEAYRRAFKYMNIVCVPVAVASILLSKGIIALVSDKYDSAAPVLVVLLFAEIFVFLGIVNNRLLVSSGRQAIDLVFTGCSAAVNVILNLLLIRQFGMIGAAAASLIAYATGPIIGLFIPFTRS
ncbi:MAG: flippase, partial [Candidatus Coatesbacteria bacterium]|nr:flippase [Candidatus Coatesbacteria bacterium]